MILTKKIRVNTKPDLDIVDITEQIQKILQESKIKNGLVNIFVPGSTASVTTMEYEQNLIKDVKTAIERIAPSNIDYEHHKTWGDENGKSHVRSTLLGPEITVPFENKKLILGTWQQIVLLDFDVPARSRELIITIMGGLNEIT